MGYRDHYYFPRGNLVVLRSEKKEIQWAIQAIADGYEGSVNGGFIVVANPDATPEALALRGESPNLVIDARLLLSMLGVEE
jgi:hypothetical protein